MHPLDLEEEPYDAARLLRLAQDKKVIAIGEIGLDYITVRIIKRWQQMVLLTKSELLMKWINP